VIESVYLDWAIGLAVVFFLGGVAVSGLNEGLNWISRVRAKFLWAYLYDLFAKGDDQRALPGGLLGVAKLWGSTLFSAVSRRDKRPYVVANPARPAADAAGRRLGELARALDPILSKQLVGKRTAVAHVPPASLAQALIEVFADLGRTALRDTVSVIVDDDAGEPEVAEAVEALKRQLALDGDLAAAVTVFRQDRSKAAAVAVADLLHPQGPDAQLRTAWSERDTDKIVAAIAVAHPVVSERARIEHALAELEQSSPVTRTLKRLWAATDGKVDEFRTDLERYLDADLRRLSGYYRRSIRSLMITLALLLAVLGGIDAVALSQSIWRNPEARAALLQRADQLADTPADAADAMVLQTLRERCRADQPVPDEGTPFDTKEKADADFAERRDCVADSIDELTGANALENALWSDPAGWAREWTSRPAGHALGTLLAALALMLGAPFWFDVIRRLTGLRKTESGKT
jgi:multisubunit Na+/H+ antiporter MnhF subunit